MKTAFRYGAAVVVTSLAELAVLLAGSWMKNELLRMLSLHSWAWNGVLNGILFFLIGLIGVSLGALCLPRISRVGGAMGLIIVSTALILIPYVFYWGGKLLGFMQENPEFAFYVLWLIGSLIAGGAASAVLFWRLGRRDVSSEG